MAEDAYTVTYLDGDYKGTLSGPDGFECYLGEPEDCSWGRDGSDAVLRLNEQHAKIERLRGALECLLPGLILDLRYADEDDDKEAMQSRITTVTEAIAKAPETTKDTKCT